MDDKYKINIEITKDLLYQRDDDPVYAQAIIDRHKEAYECFYPYINGFVLEMGCRDGTMFDVIRMYNNDHKKKFVGIDISTDALEIARHKGYAVFPIPMEEATDLMMKFDTIICLHALEHSIDVDRSIENMYILAKKGSYILIEVPMQKKEPVPTVWGHYHCFESEEEVISMFHKFKHIATFMKPNNTWRRFVFQR